MACCGNHSSIKLNKAKNVSWTKMLSVNWTVNAFQLIIIWREQNYWKISGDEFENDFSMLSSGKHDRKHRKELLTWSSCWLAINEYKYSQFLLTQLQSLTHYEYCISWIYYIGCKNYQFVFIAKKFGKNNSKEYPPVSKQNSSYLFDVTIRRIVFAQSKCWKIMKLIRRMKSLLSWASNQKFRLKRRHLDFHTIFVIASASEKWPKQKHSVKLYQW